jgi:hypothetical protein
MRALPVVAVVLLAVMAVSCQGNSVPKRSAAPGVLSPIRPSFVPVGPSEREQMLAALRMRNSVAAGAPIKLGDSDWEWGLMQADVAAVRVRSSLPPAPSHGPFVSWGLVIATTTTHCMDCVPQLWRQDIPVQPDSGVGNTTLSAYLNLDNRFTSVFNTVYLEATDGTVQMLSLANEFHVKLDTHAFYTLVVQGGATLMDPVYLSIELDSAGPGDERIPLYHLAAGVATVLLLWIVFTHVRAWWQARRSAADTDSINRKPFAEPLLVVSDRFHGGSFSPSSEPSLSPENAAPVPARKTKPARERVLSLDAFRGMCLLIMVFVNQVRLRHERL